MMAKLRVGILFGGRSGEHEVSLMSAASVITALDREKYEPVLVGIDREGRWRLVPALKGPVDAVALARAIARARPVALPADPQEPGLRPLEPEEPGLLPLRQPAAVAGMGAEMARLDVVFPVLHGTYGEDGTVQGLLELAGIPYVGAGVLASALGMDKAAMKEVFQALGIPIVPFRAVLRRRWEQEPETVLRELEAALGYPCFVKPANLGSSVGVTRCRDREELRQGLDQACRYDRKLVIEKGVRCRELECSVLGNDDPEASVVGEILPARPFYDYAAKYLDPRTRLAIPADIPEEIARQVRNLAIRAFCAIDCAGMARVDFFWDLDSGQVLVNEINTIPGFTAVSMYPKLWEASGLSYSQLLDRLIELARERHADLNRRLTSYNGHSIE